MRTITLVSILLVVSCKSDPGFEYVPAKPQLSEGAVCKNFPLGIQSASGWFDDEGVELSTIGVLSKGKGPGLHQLCGKQENDNLFTVEQALVFDREYEKATDKTRYHVCTGTISRGGKRLHPSATVTLALKGHKACEEMSRTYSHKKPKVAEKAATTPCERYTACVCAISTAPELKKSEASSVGRLCQEAKQTLASAKRDDASCKTGLKLMQESASMAYGIPVPEICK